MLLKFTPVKPARSKVRFVGRVTSPTCVEVLVPSPKITENGTFRSVEVKLNFKIVPLDDKSNAVPYEYSKFE